MVPSDERFGGKYPQFAKGIIEPGYTAKDNAIKEATEELGLKKENLINVDFLFFDKQANIHWFYGECSCMELDNPHHESLFSFWAELSQARRIIKPLQYPILELLEVELFKNKK